MRAFLQQLRPEIYTTICAVARPRSIYQTGPSAYVTRREGESSLHTSTDHGYKSHFYFETGYALFAKRPSRPFPSQFIQHTAAVRSGDQGPSKYNQLIVNGNAVRGVTNGDDAVLVSDNFVGTNDGVGAWATREKGHAALWSRLILHFWANETDQHMREIRTGATSSKPDPVAYLQRAFEATIAATSVPVEWSGTTTACAAILDQTLQNGRQMPLLYVTNLGDCQCLVVRPSDGRDGEPVFKTVEQWHWFDCPRQLGTNSPDTPNANAKMDKVIIQEDDMVLVMSDGVIDNLWEHEIIGCVIDSMATWNTDAKDTPSDVKIDRSRGPMHFIAEQLVKATRTIAEDPYAESPFMERAVEEGLAMEGGKLDDISVIVSRCRKRDHP